MPFVIVQGLPDGLNRDFLLQLRRDVTASVAKNMDAPLRWIRVFFPVDMLGEPNLPEDGCNTVYVDLDTGMFDNEEDVELNAIALRTVTGIAQVIWTALEGKFEVEIFVRHLSAKLKIIIKSVE